MSCTINKFEGYTGKRNSEQLGQPFFVYSASQYTVSKAQGAVASTATLRTELHGLIKYFSLFNHPVMEDELYRYTCDRYTQADIQSGLQQLLYQSRIRQIGAYYCLPEAPAGSVDKRIKGELLAERLLPKAKRVGRFIALFPFVKFVGISGSLSKHYADNGTDYDFFIITANNTLWICRTLLHFIKKLSFLVGGQHTLCMNYFLDEHHLQLAEKNIFVQIELSSLIPVYNQRLYHTFLLKNQANLPNLHHLGADFSKIKAFNLLERNRKNIFWKPINLFFMRWTDLKWRHKWQKRGYPMEDYDLAMKTTPHISKNHPKNYQKTVLAKLNTGVHESAV